MDRVQEKKIGSKLDICLLYHFNISAFLFLSPGVLTGLWADQSTWYDHIVYILYFSYVM